MARDPRFSIVIPTRGRVHLLEHALATACAQQLPDEEFEVVVADIASSDGTPALVHRRQCANLRHARTECALSQPDSWEFAAEQARGEWLILVGDDDGLPASFLPRIAACLDREETGILTWGQSYYFHPGWPVAHESNSLGAPSMSGRELRTDSKQELARLYARRETPTFPKLGANCAVHRDVAGLVRERVGRLFGAPIPDYAFGAAALALTRDYVTIDEPLMVCGITTSSVGMAVDRRNAEGRAFLAALGDEGRLRHVPLDTDAVANLLAETLLRVADRLHGAELDWRRYWITVRLDLEKTARFGDVSADLEHWAAVLRAEPLGRRAGVRADLARTRLDARVRPLLSAVARLGPVRAVRERLRAPGSRSPFLFVSGADAGFDTMTSAASYLEEHVLKPRRAGQPPELRTARSRPAQ